MKRLLYTLSITLLLCLGFSGCGAEQNAETDATALEIAAVIVGSQNAMPDMHPLSKSDSNFAAYLEDYFEVDDAFLEDGAVCYAGGVEASEIAVLVLQDAGNATSVEAALSAYIDSRVHDFTGYVPDQAAMAEQAVTVVNDRYVAMLICPDPETARTAFLSCFTDDWTSPDVEAVFSAAASSAQTTPASSEDVPDTSQTTQTPQPSSSEQTPSKPDQSSPKPDQPSTPQQPDSQPDNPPEADRVDTDAICAAWKQGDPSALTGKNRAVYDACQRVIEQKITGDMTPYEKELAIHDWIIDWADYDPDAHSNAPDAAPNPDNDNPYGLLIGRAAICRGYSTTFQLFMDMLDIECITIPGFARVTEEHAWNMVRLDGEWYCVDVTWDDPTGGSPCHTYFNVTSAYLRETRHSWDETSVPEATATTYAYQE